VTWLPTYDLKNEDITDKSLLMYLQDLRGRMWQKIDVSCNKLTDTGITELVGYMIANNVICKELAVHGNHEVREPWALNHLVLHPQLGAKGGFLRKLYISNVSQSFCWRLLEAVTKCHPRPPLHIVLQLENGELGPLGRVVTEAMKSHGLRVCGINDIEAPRICPLLTDSRSLDVDLVLETGDDCASVEDF